MSIKKPSPLLLAIEAYAIGREWILKPHEYKNLGSKKEKPWKVSDFYIFLDELHTPEEFRMNEKFSKVMEDESDTVDTGKTKSPPSEKLRKRYENYFKEFTSKYNVPVKFQEKSLEGSFEHFPMTILKICKDYLHEFAHSESPESLEVAIRTREPNGDILYLLVCLRHAILRKIKIEFEYESTMSMELTRRRVVPYVIMNIEYKLSLLALDLRDNEIKSFPISRIKNLKTDIEQILAAIPEENLEDFNLAQYRKIDPNATFQDPTITYKIELSEGSLNILKHSETLNYKELNEKSFTPNWKVIEVTTYRERDLFDILFNYGIYARLLSPPDSVKRFKEKLDTIGKFYQC